MAQTVAADGQEAFAAVDGASYLLRPADVISVAVYREPELSLDNSPVGSDGNIAIPLLGTVRAEGRTTEDLARAIEAGLGRGYLVDPKVAVNVMQYTSHRVTVEGAVKTPGVFQFVPGTRLSGAVALAQGPTRVAKDDQVAVFRRTAEGMTVAKFDYSAMQQGTMIDPVLQPGDRVVFATSGLSQLWQDLLQALPAFGLFTRF